MNPLYLKALHLIFVVTWFAGLFYIVRLFIYHTEASKKSEPEKSILQNQFRVMEKRLWYAIAWPSMILTWIFGLWFVYEQYGLMIPPWFIVKLCFVFGLTLYHLQCHTMFLKFKKDIIAYTSFRLRLWNEVTTLLLFSIVFIAVLKNTLDWFWGLVGVVIIGALLFFIIYYLLTGSSKK